jgi:hypothetical protein
VTVPCTWMFDALTIYSAPKLTLPETRCLAATVAVY